MQRSAWWGMLIGFCVSLSGCGANSQSTDDASADVPNSQTSEVGLSSQAPPIEGSTSDPAQVVEKFLSAVKSADERTAERLLTKLARRKTTELGIAVDPDGSDTASFEVGEVRYISQSEVHVASIWTELDEDGQPQSDRIVWALRRSADGWGIAGMATQVFEDQPPLFLDFEDPADMLRKQQLVEEEFRRRNAGQPPRSAVPGSANSISPPPGGGVQPGRFDRNDRTAGGLAPREPNGRPPQRRENAPITSERPNAAPTKRYNR